RNDFDIAVLETDTTAPNETRTMKPFAIRRRNTLWPFAFAFIIVALAWSHALPARADAAAGKNDFAACAACHSVDGSDGVGPHLYGVIGRKAGSVAGFNYSRAFKQANNVCAAKNLDSYIAILPLLV